MDDLLTVGEVAAILRVHINTVYRMLHDRRLTGWFRVGGDWRISRKTIEDWMTQMQPPKAA